MSTEQLLFVLSVGANLGALFALFQVDAAFKLIYRLDEATVQFMRRVEPQLGSAEPQNGEETK